MSSDSRPPTFDTGILRATAHPTRLKIIELLRIHPALTATECANLLGESPKTCSYHLQTLAASGFIEEVLAAGRLRPWRLVHADTAAESGAAGDVPLRQAHDRTLATRLRRDEGLLTGAMDAIEAASAMADWASVVTVYDRVAVMSAVEVQAWAEDVERVTRRHIRRSAQAAETGDGSSRHAVHLLFYGFPTLDAAPGEVT